MIKMSYKLNFRRIEISYFIENLLISLVCVINLRYDVIQSTGATWAFFLEFLRHWDLIWLTENETKKQSSNRRLIKLGTLRYGSYVWSFTEAAFFQIKCKLKSKQYWCQLWSCDANGRSANLMAYENGAVTWLGRWCCSYW